ncbi:protease modulator HflC [Sphingomonas turrisvirgatae]|uniref:Protein HflC n=1 Tax=Sphingomonas turrisvirgatae TaxID=1888892 RepID=A0A1E3LWC6_9SPHN|nr:protease modulator HflC [Sphingomonas turrisvirgatae]ODP38082.1 protease modulator HflC [Sphingomonas turrisvirgatae]
MNGVMTRPMWFGAAALVILFLLLNTVSIVPETKQAVILQLEQPVRTINQWQRGEQFGRTTGAGLIAKVPFLQRIVWVDKRVLDIELENQPVLSTDQLRLEVDAFARFRVIDPLRMVVTAGTEQRVADQLKPLFGSALRAELGKRPFASLLSPERTAVMDNIQNGLQRYASQYGVQIVDVRIKHADLPDGSPLESALQRMRTARQQEATTIRANGQKDAQIIRAEADARAAQIYAQSFNKDPQFYDFWRAMQSYRTTFIGDPNQKQGDTSIILSPDNDYLREFRGKSR